MQPVTGTVKPAAAATATSVKPWVALRSWDSSDWCGSVTPLHPRVTAHVSATATTERPARNRVIPISSFQVNAGDAIPGAGAGGVNASGNSGLHVEVFAR